jgi:hypothetical protein
VTCVDRFNIGLFRTKKRAEKRKRKKLKKQEMEKLNKKAKASKQTSPTEAEEVETLPTPGGVAPIANDGSFMEKMMKKKLAEQGTLRETGI